MQSKSRIQLSENVSVIRCVVGALHFQRRTSRENVAMQQDGGEMTTVSVYYFEVAHLQG